jgi:Protein of unknown function (DUF1579)
MKRHMLWCALALGAGLLAAVPAASGDEPKKDKKPAADANPFEAYEKAAEPGPEHKRLEAMAGSWDFTMKFWMEPGKPPTDAKGTAERKMVLGGRFLHEEVKSEMFGKPFTGVGVTGYDNVQKKYVSTWIDSMSTGISSAVGTADASGKVLTFTREDVDPVSKEKTKGRDVINLDSADKHTMEMYKVLPDGKEFKVMELTFTRSKKAAPK